MIAHAKRVKKILIFKKSSCMVKVGFEPTKQLMH